jgi:hypothetical protein
MHSKFDLMCGGRGPFLAAAAMIVAVVDFLWHACLLGRASKDYTESSVQSKPIIQMNNEWKVV